MRNMLFICLTALFFLLPACGGKTVSEGTGGAGATGAETGGAGGGTVHTTCDTLEPAFAAEAQAIRSCSSDADCGQELKGTSCGCTRSWVARIDADTTYFYELIEQSSSLECELPLGSTCDCPQADGFKCGMGGICTWNYL